MPARGQALSHLLYGQIVRGDERTAEAVREQLATEVVKEGVLALFADKSLKPGQPGTLRASRDGSAGVDRLPAQVLIPPLADGAVVLEHQPEGVEASVTAGTGRVLAVLLQHLSEGEVP